MPAYRHGLMGSAYPNKAVAKDVGILSSSSSSCIASSMARQGKARTGDASRSRVRFLNAESVAKTRTPRSISDVDGVKIGVVGLLLLLLLNEVSEDDDPLP